MCMFPRMAIYSHDINPETGKKPIRFLPRRIDDHDYEWYKAHYGKDLLLIPCGKCPSCLKSYSFNWSSRLMAESLYHEKKCFLTLTYDDEHLPKCKKVVSSLGEVRMLYPLVKKDLQDFFKRLRKALPGVQVRYFACGEHGESVKYFDWLGRPHYHVILFGYDFDDKKVISWNQLSQPLYTSEKLAKIWQNGNVSIGEVTAESCGYVARYSLKKRQSCEKTDEFVLMSRRPGIGRQYYEDKKDKIYLSDRIYNPKFVSASVPRYFDNLADVDEDALVYHHFKMSKDARKRRADGKEYLEMIHYGLDRVEEAQNRVYEESQKAMMTLRRAL